MGQTRAKRPHCERGNLRLVNGSRLAPTFTKFAMARLLNQSSWPAAAIQTWLLICGSMKKTKSHLETLFASILATMTAAPRPDREFRFHPVRQWRIDFAWPAYRVAIEIDGGIFMRDGRYNHGP